MSITGEKFEELVRNYDHKDPADRVVGDDLDYVDYLSELDYAKSGSIFLDNKEVAKWEFLDGETGGEGSAEDIWLVIKITDESGSKLWRKTGWYASYDGSNWDGDWDEVEAYEKVVTAYRRIS